MTPRLRLAALSLLALLASPAAARPGGLVTPLSGLVEVRLAGEEAFVSVDSAAWHGPGARVRTGADGWSTIEYDDGTRVTVKPATEVVVGGASQEGVLVEVGGVLVRARRLLGGQEHRTRSPIAVAAIRGTDFGLDVDRSGRTLVRVRQGKVAVTNRRLTGPGVLVGAGEMTIVEPLRPPSPPARYGAGEFDAGDLLGSLELAEDPVMESTESPVVESFLAFPDPEIDALRNPASLARHSDGGSRTLLALGGAAAHDRVDLGAGDEDVERTRADEQRLQHLSRLSRGATHLGLYAEAQRTALDETGVPHQPFEVVSPRRRTDTGQQIADVRLLAGGSVGGTALGLTVGGRRSVIDVDDRVVGAPAASSTKTTSRLGRLQVGAERPLTAAGTVGLTWSHGFLSSTTRADTLHKKSHGHTDLVEFLRRRRRGPWSSALLLQVQSERTSEDVRSDRTIIYDESRNVWALRGGGGIGRTVGTDVVASVDGVAGVSRERATQRLPTGGIRERETDVRFATNLHLGLQVRVTKRLLWIADVHVLTEYIDKEFDLLPGSDQAARREEARFGSGATMATGVGWRLGVGTLQYLLRGGDGGPVTHGLVLTLDRS